MATVTNKREVLRAKGKVKVIWATENRKKRRNLTCGKFGFVNRTIQKIWKNIFKIISAFQQDGLKLKRFRKPGRSDVDEALHKWLKQQKSGNVTVMITLVPPKFYFKLIYF
jgi:hypothetical protein